MTHRFKDYEPWKGEIPMRKSGSIISHDTGIVTAYALDKLQDRGVFFVSPNDYIYAGQIIGEHNKPGDIGVNATKAKQLTNIRASGSDDNVLFKTKIKLMYLNSENLSLLSYHKLTGLKPLFFKTSDSA